MIKVPATAAGVPAIEELTARGVNVNVTLLFSVQRYEQVIDAYLTGLERRAAAGEPLTGVASVASFFISRVDAEADARLPADSPLRGKVAVANAHRAYGRYLAWFSGQRWEALRRRGAAPQRPLWASTGTKDPHYSDVRYVEELIAPGVINTMPEQTLRAFADHGTLARALDPDSTAAEHTLAEAAAAGLDLTAITAKLERAGVSAFSDSYRQLLDCIESKLDQLPVAVLHRLPQPPRTPRHPPQRPDWERVGGTPRAMRILRDHDRCTSTREGWATWRSPRSPRSLANS